MSQIAKRVKCSGCGDLISDNGSSYQYCLTCDYERKNESPILHTVTLGASVSGVLPNVRNLKYYIDRNQAIFVKETNTGVSIYQLTTGAYTGCYLGVKNGFGIVLIGSSDVTLIEQWTKRLTSS